MPVEWVTKVNGTRQRYSREKIIETCLRIGASKEAAVFVADKVERRLYDDVSTDNILRLIFEFLRKYRSDVKHRIDLRKAIGLLRPKPDFEKFVQLLLEEYGYSLSCNPIVRGRCVEHEIDAIARKGDITFLVEIKHHYDHHIYTGLDIPRIAQATLEDLVEGYSLGLTSIKFDKALIVCNTKYSEHAIRYAECRGIDHIGWKAPPNLGLDSMIEEKKLYPITLLRGLDRKTREELANNGILLLKQLATQEADSLSKRLRVPKQDLEKLIQQAKETV